MDEFTVRHGDVSPGESCAAVALGHGAAVAVFYGAGSTHRAERFRDEENRLLAEGRAEALRERNHKLTVAHITVVKMADSTYIVVCRNIVDQRLQIGPMVAWVFIQILVIWGGVRVGSGSHGRDS